MIANVLVGVSTISVNPTAGTAVGGAGWVDLGYTEDGVQFAYDAETAEVFVIAQTFPVGRIISRENLDVNCRMAENSLVNFDVALAGAVLAGDVITLDAGAVKQLALKVVGTGPEADKPVRTIYIPYCTAVGRVLQSYRKASKALIPVTFRALKETGVDVCTITDSA